MENMRPNLNSIAGALSLNFEACNMVSGEAHSVAEALASQGRSEPMTLFIMDETSAQIPYHLNGITVTEPGDGVRLLLATSRTKDQQASHPMPRLLAVVRDDIAVPIATFGESKNTYCGMTMLGQEQTDDEFVITPRDSRLTLVSEVRTMLKNRLEGKDPDAIPPSIKAFVNSEIEKLSGQLAIAEDAAICRLAKKKLTELIPESRYLWFNEDEAGSVHKKMKVAYLSDTKYSLSDGRQVDLALVQGEGGRKQKRDEGTDTYLAAIVRGDVALPLVRFAADGVIRNCFDESELNDESSKAIDAILKPGNTTNYGYKIGRMLNSIDAAAQLESVLGEYNPDLENLFDNLGNLLRHKKAFSYSGVIEDFNVKENTADVAYTASLSSEDDGTITIEVDCKPVVYAGIGQAMAIRKALFITGKTDLPKDDIAELDWLIGDTVKSVQALELANKAKSLDRRRTMLRYAAAAAATGLVSACVYGITTIPSSFFNSLRNSLVSAANIPSFKKSLGEMQLKEGFEVTADQVMGIQPGNGNTGIVQGDATINIKNQCTIDPNMTVTVNTDTDKATKIVYSYDNITFSNYSQLLSRLGATPTSVCTKLIQPTS